MRNKNQVFPAAIGTEIETGLLFKLQGRSRLGEVDSFENGFFHYRVNEDDYNQAGITFLSNGYRLYSGGAKNSCRAVNPEIVTPETLTPSDAVLRQSAGIAYYLRHLEGFAEEHNRSAETTNRGIKKIENIRFHQRMIDAEGTTKGCHDNYDITHLTDKQRAVCMDTISRHSATRGFISGMGYVGADGEYYLGQKLSNIVEHKGRSQASTLYFYKGKDDAANQVLELRSSDPNILPDAALLRIGAPALIIALAAAGFTAELEDINRLYDEEFKIHPDYVFPRRELPIKHAIRSNNTLHAVDAGSVSVRYQEQLASAAVDLLPGTVDMTGEHIEYLRIAQDWLRYVADYKKVRSGEAGMELLATRADWAMRHKYILRGMKRDTDAGLERTFGDYESMMADMRYDMVTLTPQADDGCAKQYGQGHRIAERLRPKSQAVYFDSAQKQPPETRAKLRSEVIRRVNLSGIAKVIAVDWNSVMTYSDHAGQTIIDLPDDPSQTMLDEHNAGLLQQILEPK